MKVREIISWLLSTGLAIVLGIQGQPPAIQSPCPPCPPQNEFVVVEPEFIPPAPDQEDRRPVVIQRPVKTPVKTQPADVVVATWDTLAIDEIPTVDVQFIPVYITDTVYVADYNLTQKSGGATAHMSISTTGEIVAPVGLNIQYPRNWIEASAGPVLGAPDLDFSVGIGVGRKSVGLRADYRLQEKTITPQLVLRVNF